jgi:glycine oxidase
MVARDTDDLAELERLLAHQHDAGLDAERLTSRECRRREPRLSSRVRGGILVPGDHQVDNRALVAALLTACDRAGVRMERTRVDEITMDGDRVTGVSAGGTRTRAGQVVLAGGAWSGEVGGLPPGTLPPVRPVKGQLLHLRGPAEPPLATGNVRGLDVYLVPRADGRLVVGATVEERGHDTTVTAGAVADLLRDAIELVPDVAELELTETVAGLRPGSPDNAPLLGQAGPGGLVVAAGHYRNGVLLTPVTAAGITELLIGGKVPDLLVPFGPERFREAA